MSKLAIIIRHPQLETDWDYLIGHLRKKLSNINFVVGVWAKPSIWKNNMQPRTWFKKQGIPIVESRTIEEAGRQLAAINKADLLWVWEGNERMTAEFNSESIAQALKDNGNVRVTITSDRLRYSAKEKRLHLVELLGSLTEHRAEKLTENEYTVPFKGLELSKALIVPVQDSAGHEELFRDYDAVGRLLLAFGTQNYEYVLSASEPPKSSPEWATFRFYRILAAYNKNRMEEASQWIYDALDEELDSSLELDFIYLYGKLAQNASIDEMKREAYELLESTIQSNPLIETFHVKTSESTWLALVAELKWQLGLRNEALLSLKHSLESSSFTNVEAAFRLAELIYEQFYNEGVEKVARTVLDSFTVENNAARLLLYPIFSYLNMQEWAYVFKPAETAGYAVEGQEHFKQHPQVSIVLPVYNDDKYLFESIHSILCQTYINFELIVVDDGSTANIERIVKQFSYDSRLKYYKLAKNMGLPAALNHGFSFAKGTILGWTSADNRAHPRWLEKMVQSLVKNSHAAAVYSDYYHFDHDGFIMETKRMSAYKLNGLQNGGPSMLWRASAYRLIGNFDTSLFGIEDRDFTVRLALSGPIIHLPESLYYYRIHADSLSSKIESGSHGGWSELHDKLKEKWLFLSFV